MQKAQQSWWLVLGVAIAVLIALPSSAQDKQAGIASLLACPADAASQAALPALDLEGEIPATPDGLSLEAPAAEPLTGPPGSCPRPTCDARVHCLYLACPAGQSAACFGGLGAGCEGTCGCR